MELTWKLAEIVMVNLVLSGDNAVVIAMASRNLPEAQRRFASMFGCGLAVVARLVLSLAAVFLLRVPYVQLLGGILLLWIAAKLLISGEEDSRIHSAAKLWVAVRTIVVADLVMSLDNTLAIAAVADGHFMLLAAGLLLSVPVIIFGSQVISVAMNRFPAVIYVGAGLIAWTAAQMIFDDARLGYALYSLVSTSLEWLLPAFVATSVLVFGYIRQLGRKQSRKESARA